MFEVTWFQRHGGEVHSQRHEFATKEEAIEHAKGLGKESQAAVHDKDTGNEVELPVEDEKVAEKSEDEKPEDEKPEDKKPADKPKPYHGAGVGMGRASSGTPSSGTGVVGR